MLPDHIFRKYDIRGVADAELTDETVEAIGRAYGTMLRRSGGRKVAVGRDCRLSSPRILETISEALRATGIDVVDVGMVPSPLLYFTVFREQLDGGIQVTGSHNPPEYNGLKLMRGNDALFGGAIDELKRAANEGDFEDGDGEYRSLDILPSYVEFVSENIEEFQRDIRVVVDAGNGAAGPAALAIYEALGVDVVPIHCEPDGRFPAHHPDPTLVENLEYLGQQVRKEGAELGIGFDGDGDRIGVVDENGEIVWGDRLLVVLARAVLAEEPGSTILGEVKCSQVLFDAIEEAGGEAVMGQVGHSIMKAEMKRLNAPLAGELSGHIFYAHRFFGYDDAAYVGARLMEILTSSPDTLGERLSDLPETFSTPEIRVDCPDDEKFMVVERVSESLSEEFPVVTVDGVRAQWDDGWGLVRASNTQPAIVVRAEARTQGRCDAICRRLKDEIETARRDGSSAE
jgi:phosphomannomutase/phosphoglucomutase